LDLDAIPDLAFDPPGSLSYQVGEIEACCWVTIARCWGCRRTRAWSAAELGRAFPARASIGAIAARLTCDGCGSKGAWATFRNDHSASREKTMKIYAQKFGEEAARPAGTTGTKKGPEPKPGA
jgi:hypothetical protein